MNHNNPELELAWNFVEKTNRNIFLTGKAGTGKTTFLHKIRDESFKRLVVVAPTGVAAINARGVTIHSFFQMSFGPILPADVNSPQNSFNNSSSQANPFQKKFNKRKIDIIRSLDLLIIDEVSMVRADLLDGIDQVLRKYKDKNKVFGGVQVLMIGDLQQLAPVVKNEEWKILQPYYETAFFFSSRVFQESNALGIELKHIYRQKNEQFIGILNEIRNNCLSDISLKCLNERYQPNFKPSSNDGYITLTTHNDRANEMNEKELKSIDRKSFFFNADVDGDFPEFSYPNHFELELKVGAQVMFIKNDSSPEKRYFNGKIGKVVQIDGKQVVVRCPEDDADISTTAEIWENIKYNINEETKELKETVIGTFSQIPLRLAWAITIHKSQGLTFEKAIIDAAASFAHGQTYVALSRCKTLEGIVLKTPINKNGIIQDTRVISFNNEVENHPPKIENLLQSQKSYQLDLIAELFDYKSLFYPLNRAQKIIYQSGNSLQGNIIDPLKTAKEKGFQELVKIADTFTAQLRKMTQQLGEPENQSEIQQRFKKAVEYFSRHTTEFLEKPMSELSYSTDNKTIDKDFKEEISKIKEIISVKLFCLEGMKEGFQTSKYLEVRAKSILQKVKVAEAPKREVSSDSNPKLFKLLRQLRHEIATAEDINHYQVFSQKTLLEICEFLPTNKRQLKAIHGMGKVRIQKYGDEILDIIKEYCEEKEIEIAEEIPEKISIPKLKKENSKLVSLTLFKNGKSIAEIAKEREFAISTIEGHLTSFIKTGEIKLEDLMNAEKAEIMRKLVKSSTFENLTELRSQLGDKFSYSELRMVVEDLNAD